MASPRVAVLAAGDPNRDGCAYYRMLAPSAVLASRGYPVSFDHRHQFQRVMQPSPFGDRCVGILNPPDVDVVVFQRVLTRGLVEIIDVLQTQHDIAVVVEIDDSFHDLPPRHPARADTDPLRDAEKNRGWLARACERADLVTVTTPALAERYGRHGRVAILPNYVPQRYLSIERVHHDGVWVGWTGSTDTHVGDINITKGAVGEAIAETGAEFRCVGTGKGVREGLALPADPVSTGWMTTGDYPTGMAQFDVGIAPLKDNAFNRGKSSLKVLEGASLGVAMVASPSAEYRRLHEDHGIGVIAETPAEWKASLVRLIRDRQMREEKAAQDRAAVAESLVLEDHVEEWMEAWTEAYRTRQMGHAA